MGSQGIITKLKNLRGAQINPRSEWLQNSRALLLSQIKNTLPARPERPLVTETIWERFVDWLPNRTVYAIVRPALIILIVIAVGTSSWITTVDAAYEALPGDWLYPAKRAVEKTQVAVAVFMGDAKAETKVHLRLAERRAVEANKMVKQRQTDTSKKAEAVTAVVKDLQGELASINNALTATSASSSSALSAETAKEVKNNTERIETVLKDVKSSLMVVSPGDPASAREVAQAVNETKDLVKDVAVKAVASMVASHLNGDQTVSSAEVRQELNKVLESATTDVGESKQSVDGVKTSMAAATTEVKNLTAEAVKQSGPAAATTTAQLTQQLSTVSNQTVAAVLKTEAVSAEVAKKVGEAKELLSTGELSKVVDTIKAVNEATKAAEKISDTALEKAQTVLPAVQVIKDGSGASTIVPSPSSTSIIDIKSVTVNGDISLTSTLKIVSTTVTINR